MLCRGFKESSDKRLELKEVDSRAFCTVLELWCGGKDCNRHGQDWDAMQQLSILADRFQITDVLAALEESIIEKLSIDVCLEVLAWSSWIGLKQLEAEARKMMSERFNDFMETDSFLNIEEETLRSILAETRVDEVENALRMTSLWIAGTYIYVLKRITGAAARTCLLRTPHICG